MSESVSSLGKPPPSPSALPPKKTVSLGGVSYSKTLPEKAQLSIDTANALMQKLGEANAPEAISTLKKDLFETMCDLRQHLAKSALNKDVSEKVRKEMEKTIEACTKHLQPGKAGADLIDTHLALETKLKAHDVRVALQGLACSVPESLKKTFSDLVKKGEALESFIPVDGAISSQDLASVQREINLFDKAVRSFEGSLVADLATDLQLTEDEARQIFDAARQNWGLFVLKDEEVSQIFNAARQDWKPFIEEMPDGIIKQNHNIKGLKIYRFEGRLVADFGIQNIGKGSFKRAKAIQEAGSGELVRLTSITKDPEEKEIFEDDVGREIHNREIFRTRKQEYVRNHPEYQGDPNDIPNITKITEIKYMNKKGELKTRYIMMKYDSDLWSMVHPGTSRYNPERALECCVCIFDSLEELHMIGMSHGDLKPANVLCLGKEGHLNDFGLAAEHGAPTNRGVASYFAPETLFEEYPDQDPSMDMFSMGIILLEIADPPLATWFCRYTKDLQNYIDNHPNEGYAEQMYKHFYETGFKALRQNLGKDCTPLRALIRDLTRDNPKERPTAAEAKKRFHEIMKGGTAEALKDPNHKKREIPDIKFDMK